MRTSTWARDRQALAPAQMAQLETEACWATGLDIATTGLARSERQQVQAIIEAAGGRCARINLPATMRTALRARYSSRSYRIALKR